MFPYTSLPNSSHWQPGPLPGVELQVLHKNPDSGALMVLRKFQAGSVIPAHTHPLADEHVYVISGEWIEEGVTYGPGSSFFAPKGVKHGPHEARGEVISLTLFSGPLTVT